MKKITFILSLIILISAVQIISSQTNSYKYRYRGTPYNYGIKRNTNTPKYTGTARDYARRRTYGTGYGKKQYSGASRRQNMKYYNKYRKNKYRRKYYRRKNYSSYRKPVRTYSSYKNYIVLTAKTSNIGLQNQLNTMAKRGYRLVATMRNKLIFEK